MSTTKRYRAAVERKGLIADFTMMLGPLSALVPFAQAMGERAHAADRSKIGRQTARA